MIHGRLHPSFSSYRKHPRLPVTYRSLLRAALAATLTLVATSLPLSAQQSCPATTPGATMPLTYQGGPTVAAITPCDLMTRLYIYSADSLRGREAGTPDAIHATAYIESEVRRLGLRPPATTGRTSRTCRYGAGRYQRVDDHGRREDIPHGRGFLPGRRDGRSEDHGRCRIRRSAG